MTRSIDCLFIGHNEMDFQAYENTIGRMGAKSPAYRDLNLNFIRYQKKPYSAPEIFNLFSAGTEAPLTLGDTFSAAIAYLGTYIHRRGYTFDYINSFRNEKSLLIEKLKNCQIQAIAITTTLYVSFFPIVEIVSLIRQYNKTAKILIGGPFVSTNVRTQDGTTLEYLFEAIGADVYINSSQGEAALVNVLYALKNNQPLKGIQNIYFKEGGKFTAGEMTPEDNKLGENMVDWQLFADRIGSFAAVRTAISCPFTCAFCGFPQHAGQYQTTGLNAIERELDSLEAVGKVKSVNFIDDTFNVPPERFKEILRLMIRKKYTFKWHSYFRCQYADEETIELMKASGCEGVFLGIESGNQQILHNMNKKVQLESYKKGIKLLKEKGIVTFASFVTGFPGETKETVQDTIDFIEETQPDFYRTQLWYCEPITPIWKEKDKYRIKGSQFEWSHETMDSQKACDCIDEIFLTVKNSLWLSQYNFDFVNIFHILHRGYTLEAFKNFVESFNSGLRDKLINPTKKEISQDVKERLEKACRGDK